MIANFRQNTHTHTHSTLNLISFFWFLFKKTNYCIIYINKISDGMVLIGQSIPIINHLSSASYSNLLVEVFLVELKMC